MSSKILLVLDRCFGEVVRSSFFYEEPTLESGVPLILLGSFLRFATLFVEIQVFGILIWIRSLSVLVVKDRRIRFSFFFLLRGPLVVCNFRDTRVQGSASYHATWVTHGSLQGLFVFEFFVSSSNSRLRDSLINICGERYIYVCSKFLIMTTNNA